MTDEQNKDPWLGEPPAQDNQSQRPQDQDVDTAPWERRLIEKMALGLFREQRRTRRWGIFFKALFFVYLFTLLFLYLPEDVSDSGVSIGKHTALVDVRGVIADDAEANAEDIIHGLRAAYKNKKTVAVILRINSPGGSPVQAGYVADEIVRLRGKYPDIPLYAVIGDICASGGYYIAAVADEIYADKASIVGSIGVLMNGFGFVDAMQRLGIERRLLTAGEHKGFLDPFSPLRKDERQHVEKMLQKIHQQFIATVRKGRGERLHEEPDLFSGLAWTGEQGVELGLVDGLGSASYVAREIIGEENIVDFTPRQPVFERLAQRIGTAMGRTIVSSSALTLR